MSTLDTSLDAVAGIIRRSLAEGQRVEIEGLGSFRAFRRAGAAGSGASGLRCQFSPQTSPEVFIAYVAEDLALARRLCEALRAEGCSPWLDKDKLLPGQNWRHAITRAIEVSDAFVAGFSQRSVLKRGQFQSELRSALECARQRPLDETFLIPVRFEECVVPRSIADKVQYVDLFPDWEKGVRRIARAIRKNAAKRPMLALE